MTSALSARWKRFLISGDEQDSTPGALALGHVRQFWPALISEEIFEWTGTP